MVTVGLDIECSFDAFPLAAKFWIVADGKFVLGIFGLRFDKVFVDALLNVVFVVGHSIADVVAWRFRQQINEKTAPGIQAFPLVQNNETIFQHILDVKRPQRWWDEHPVIKRSQLLNNRIAEFRDGRMVVPESSLSPLVPMKSPGPKFLQVEIKCFSHGIPDASQGFEDGVGGVVSGASGRPGLRSKGSNVRRGTG